MLRFLGRPIRTVLRWQLVATAVLTAAVLEWAASEPLPNRVLLVGYDRTMADRFAAALAAN